MDLAALLARQAGVVSLAQAAAAGLSATAVRRRVAAGAWIRVHPRVYRVATHPPSDDARIWAAACWAGAVVGLPSAGAPSSTAPPTPRPAVAHTSPPHTTEVAPQEHATPARTTMPTASVPTSHVASRAQTAQAVLSGAAAAYVHGMMPRAPFRIEVTVGTDRRWRPPPGITLRRKDLAAVDRGTHGGVAATEPALTALETALVVPDAASFLDRALQRHVGLAEVQAAFARNRGTRGWPTLRPLLESARDRTASPSERLFIALLRGAGLGGWVVNLRVDAGVLDVAFPARMIAVELDSWAWHVDADRYHGDRRKQNALVAAGWTVLRFTWQDLTQRPDQVLALVRHALDRPA